MRFGALAATTATSSLVLGAVVSLAPGQNVPQPVNDRPVPASTILKFDHAQHGALDEPVAIAQCQTCHGNDKGGVLAQPGRVGHQPCFSSGCHAEDFLSVGARTRREAPERYARAASFCQGCHQSTKGQPPSPYQSAKADNTYVHNQNPGHYVEFNHLEHTERTGCRSCHVVDAKTFALDLEGPGHSECATCHKDHEEPGMPPGMANCASCHHPGSPTSYFKERKFSSDVRSCQSQRYQKLAAKRKATNTGKNKTNTPPPCFEHERKGHRFRSGGEPVECKSCHFMFESKSYEGHNYQTLLGIKQAPLMDNSFDRAHKKCGTSGCHAGAVDESSGQGRCDLCHSKRSILDSLVDKNWTRPGFDSDRFDDEAGSKDGQTSKDSGLDDLIEGGDSPRKQKRRKRPSLKDLVD